jgi:hypothetical protein
LHQEDELKKENVFKEWRFAYEILGYKKEHG